MATKFDSPALKEQASDYPFAWHGKVPARVLMDTTVKSELPWERNRFIAHMGLQYDAYVNSYGAVCAILPDGEMIGLKPYEFTVLEWHELPDADLSKGG